MSSSPRHAERAPEGSSDRPLHWRALRWAAAVLVLVLPLIAMRFTEEVDWTASDFVFAGLLLFGSLGTYEVAARRSVVHRAGIGLGIAATFLILWLNGAVYLTDSAADALYYGVALLGAVGVGVALFRPLGGALVMVGSALAMGGVTVGALVTGMVPNPYASVLEVLGITGFFGALYLGSAVLLRQAAREATA